MRTYPAAFFYIFLLLLLTDCSADSEDTACSFEVEGIEGICGVFSSQTSFGGQEELITEVIKETVLAINAKMPIRDLKISIVFDPAMIIPEIGLGGFNPSSDEVIISIDPRLVNLGDVLQRELAPLLAHEVHHAKRRRSVGYGSTLLEAMISEGLADHFAMEITGASPPPWSVALSGDELENWTTRAKENWHQRPYNHEAWFFGIGSTTPRWAGYSIGFELVKNYLEAVPDRLPSNLHEEAATSFVVE